LQDVVHEPEAIRLVGLPGIVTNEPRQHPRETQQAGERYRMPGYEIERGAPVGVWGVWHLPARTLLLLNQSEV